MNGRICLQGKGVYVLRASDCDLDRTTDYQKYPDTTLHFQRIKTQAEWSRVKDLGRKESHCGCKIKQVN